MGGSSNALKCEKHGTNQNICVCFFPSLLLHSLSKLRRRSTCGKSPCTDQEKKKICLMLRSGRWLGAMQFYYTHFFFFSFFPPIPLWKWGRTGAEDPPSPQAAAPQRRGRSHPRCQAPSSDTAGDDRAAIKPRSSSGPPKGAVLGCTGLYYAAPGRAGLYRAVRRCTAAWEVSGCARRLRVPGTGGTSSPSNPWEVTGACGVLPCPRLISLSEV